MGVPVLIMGETGSGKTYSLKTFDPKEVGIFSVEKGRLPFRGNYGMVKHATYKDIQKIFANPKLKRYVIDDSQYLLVNELFDRAKDTGYQKYTDMALAFRNLIHDVNHRLPEDVIVYFLHHTEQDGNTGKIKAKTVGKMIDQYLTLEGCFDVVLMTAVEGAEHSFITQSDGFSTCKSPEGMFPSVKIPNDLKMVDSAIRKYWEL
ncbi:MAG: AAA family ATPase [Oscillospiraceae bacterium]|nr:AAA family ATPase [Oscillospiraceae bacterium]